MPEECVLLHAHAFCDAQMGIEPLMEPYGELVPAQQDLRRVVPLLRATCCGCSNGSARASAGC